MGSSFVSDRIANVLKSIGLSKNEVKIFLDLIRKGESSVLEISRRTEIHRPNVYDSLRVLMEKGFVSERSEGPKKIFQALDPIRIEEYMAEKKREIDRIVPELQQISARKSEKGSVSISQGVFAFRGILTSFLEIGEEINVYGISKGMRRQIGYGFLDEFHDRRIEAKIPMKIIYTKEAFSKNVLALSKRDFTEARYEEIENSLDVATFICGDKVFITTCGGDFSTVEIVSAEIARAYRAYFDILWRSSFSYQDKPVFFD